MSAYRRRIIQDEDSTQDVGHSCQQPRRLPPPSAFKSIQDFIRFDIPIHQAEGSDLLHVIESASTLMMDIAVDCLDTNGNVFITDQQAAITKIHSLVNQVGPVLDLADTLVKSSDYTLNKVLAQISDPNRDIPQQTDAIYTQFQSASTPPFPIPSTATYTTNMRAQLYEMTKNSIFQDDVDLDESNQDLVITSMIEDFRCPITAGEFRNPIKSNLCGHHYEENAIKQLILQRRNNRSNQPIECPVAGCTHFVSIQNLVQDPLFKSKLRLHLRQQQSQHHRI